MPTSEKFSIDPSWTGVIRWGGLSLFISGIIALVFFILVVSTQQTLPVPAKEALETPLLPSLLFAFVIIGELLLVPSGLALFFSLKSINKNLMTIATSFWILCVPMFLTSRGLIFAISQISDRYLNSSTEIMKMSYIASAELALETQNIYAMTALILLSLGSIFIGKVMLKAKEVFGKIGYAVIVAGIFTFFGAISVVVKEVPIIFPVIGVILTAIWQFYIGLKLFKLADIT
jgi:hypothetical protein